MKHILQYGVGGGRLGIILGNLQQLWGSGER